MPTLIDDFCRNGFTAVREAFSRETARACLAAIHDELRAHSVDPHDRSTWTKPVVRFNCPIGPAFEAAATSPALWKMYDTLLGPGRWLARGDGGVGGSVPVRFPSEEDPGDAGWHIDGSYDVNGQWWVNVHSRDRALLALVLFSDVGENDAPTEILVGSHMDVPRILAPYGEKGVSVDVGELPPATFDRERARATGRAGDVFLCHPFLVHRATWPHRGVGPRVIAQPGISHRSFALRDEPGISVVERTILEALA
jgi:hypothetical protein